MVNGAVLATSSAADKFCLAGLPGSVTITLAWHDPPGAESAAKALVNDLDLSVSIGDGTRLLGNGAVDRVNNVERVSVQPPRSLPQDHCLQSGQLGP